MVAVVTEVEIREAPPPPKWLLIIAGILWVLVSLVVLSLDATSAATIGYLTGFVLIFGGVDELVAMVAAPSWRWLHAIAGVLFVVVGIGALLEPFQTFGILALFIGWYLIIKGSFDTATAIVLRHDLPLWGLGLGIGITEIIIGLWALGYPGRSAWLLLVWIGVGALLRGIGDFVAAFTRGAHS